MKGRIYDPKLGRFLTPDPIVPRPLFGQSWNGYSYVLNNPLTYTDPSGFSDEDAGQGLAPGTYVINGEIVIVGPPRKTDPPDGPSRTVEGSRESVELGPTTGPPTDLSTTGSRVGFIPQARLRRRRAPDARWTSSRPACSSAWATSR
jgi:hypothetical protein